MAHNCTDKMAGNCYENGTMVLEMVQTKDSPNLSLEMAKEQYLE